MSHVTRMNESWHKYGWVMAHMKWSCHVYRSHVTYWRVVSHMNASGRIWMSHVTCEWVMFRTEMLQWRDEAGNSTHKHSRQRAARYLSTWLIRMRDMPHSRVWHDVFIFVTCLIHTRDMTHLYAWHDSFICVTWLIHIVTWLIHMCDMNHSYVWHASSICVM